MRAHGQDAALGQGPEGAVDPHLCLRLTGRSQAVEELGVAQFVPVAPGPGRRLRHQGQHPALFRPFPQGDQGRACPQLPRPGLPRLAAAGQQRGDIGGNGFPLAGMRGLDQPLEVPVGAQAGSAAQFLHPAPQPGGSLLNLGVLSHGLGGAVGHRTNGALTVRAVRAVGRDGQADQGTKLHAAIFPHAPPGGGKGAASGGNGTRAQGELLRAFRFPPLPARIACPPLRPASRASSEVNWWASRCWPPGGAVQATGGLALQFGLLTVTVSDLLLGAVMRERRQWGARLLELALHDPLTGLGNRRLFGERVAQALERAPAPGTLAVLLMDFDNFKAINDSLGHTGRGTKC